MLLSTVVTKLLTEQGADVKASRDHHRDGDNRQLSGFIPFPFHSSTPHPRMDIPSSSAPPMARAQIELTNMADLLTDLLANRDRDLRERNGRR